MLALFVKIPTI